MRVIPFPSHCEDIGEEANAAIPLPNVTGKILDKVIQYCTHHVNDPAATTDERKDDKRTDDITPWDADFCKVDQATLFELILVIRQNSISLTIQAANYLDIKPLLDLTCKTVANMIKGASY